jgi:hypothetical protein
LVWIFVKVIDDIDRWLLQIGKVDEVVLYLLCCKLFEREIVGVGQLEDAF